MAHTYHYCAQRQSGGAITLIDGIAHMNGEITEMDDYRELKRLVAVNNDTAGLTITSMTYLGHHRVKRTTRIGPPKP